MTRRQLTDEQRRLIAPFLPIGKHGPYPERLRNQFEGVMWRFRTDAQWREISISAISQVWHATLRAGIRPDAAPMPTWRVTCT